ncbi:hypothetical protein [Neisseria sp.]|uniref:hypothetical protein n=1 Tax=Neisseria sp. TaxID=192066 RepID=UPI0035A0267A
MKQPLPVLIAVAFAAVSAGCAGTEHPSARPDTCKPAGSPVCRAEAVIGEAVQKVNRSIEENREVE